MKVMSFEEPVSRDLLFATCFWALGQWRSFKRKFIVTEPNTVKKLLAKHKKHSTNLQKTTWKSDKIRRFMHSDSQRIGSWRLGIDAKFKRSCPWVGGATTTILHFRLARRLVHLRLILPEVGLQRWFKLFATENNSEHQPRHKNERFPERPLHSTKI